MTLMKKRWFALLLAVCLLPIGAALADWSAPDANLSYYEGLYGEASESYRRIRYGNEGETVAEIKQKLMDLGYFANKIGNTYHRTLETAIRVFAGQLRLGGDGQEVTPLMQAMLADSANLPQAISPAIDVSAYSWEENTTFTAYTYARVTRTSVQQDTSVGFSGRITTVVDGGDTFHYVVEMESDPEKVVYVSYQPLPRTTRFQLGDEVTVFGVTQGLQTLTFTGMTAEQLLVKADRIGYTK